MTPFGYLRVPNAGAAITNGARHRSDRAREPGADFLAGGTGRMQLMGEHLRNPDRRVRLRVEPRRHLDQDGATTQ